MKEKSKFNIMRIDYENMYFNKYYNLFMNNFKFEGLSEEQTDFILRKFWSEGSIAAFVAKDTQGAEGYPNGMLVLCLFAPNSYNLYDWPITVTLTNTRGMSYIPNTPQEVNKEVVIGYIQRNKKGVAETVYHYVKRLAAIEAVIKVNLKANKTPWLLASDPENKNKMENFWRELDSDNPRLFIELEQADKARAVVSGAPYIIDKLYNFKIAIENELREYLGLGNLGISEKKEHLITAEIEANDDITARYSECILNPMQEFCERVTKILGYPLSVKLNAPEPVELPEEEESENEE